ncbi:hypothetical protein [Saccharophagus degradans]|nr:hypothetical protein [Saccharophagus degradans]
MIHSVLNEGVKGMQASQREMQKAAHEIASTNIPASTQAAPQNPADAAIPPVSEPPKSGRVGNIAEPIVELKRQELLFTASAAVVSTANKTIGSLLDVKS